MATTTMLQRYWQQWEPKLEALVKDKGAKLTFPAGLIQEKGSRDGTAILRPKMPVCISNAPEKASSRRAGKQVILIDGSFEVNVADKAPHLVKPTCNVTIFRSEELPTEKLTLDLVESMHFDMEAPFDDEDRKQFHPIFHAQRGESLTADRCKEVLGEVYHLGPEQIHIEVKNKAVIGTPYLRLPTPQLDLFSVMTIVAADFFCNAGDAQRDRRIDDAQRKNGGRLGSARHDRSNVVDRFVSILDLLRKPENVARAGDSSLALFTRITKDDHISTGHWYPEWRPQVT